MMFSPAAEADRDLAVAEAKRLLVEGNYESALDIWQDVLSIRPDDTEAHYYLALLYKTKGDMGKCVHHMEKTKLSPGHSVRVEPYEDRMDFLGKFSQKQNDAIDRCIPPILFSALPKSASVFIAEFFMDRLDIPVCRASEGWFRQAIIVPNWIKRIAKGGAITHEHFRGSGENLKRIRESGIRRCLVEVRDPRQAILSLVHHLNKRHVGIPEILRMTPEKYLKLSLSERVDLLIDRHYGGMVQWILEWLDARRSSREELEILIVAYEDFTRDKVGFFKRIMDFHDLPKRYSSGLEEQIAEMERRQVTADREGVAVPYNYREGRADEWRDELNEAQKDRLRQTTPRRLLETFAWPA